MTATDILRRLLDERGVEWRVGDYPTTCTVWESGGIVWYGLWRDGCIELIAWQVTPEQAIDATLGLGTCHFEQIPEALYDDIECSECGVALWGFQMDIAGEGCPTKPRYCPNCGRKVVE